MSTIELFAPSSPAYSPPEIPAKIQKIDDESSENIAVKIKKLEQTILENEKSETSKENLWKLFKGKYLFTFYLCEMCKERLFNDKNKAKKFDDRVELKFNLCLDCVKKNVFATDLLAPRKKK